MSSDRRSLRALHRLVTSRVDAKTPLRQWAEMLALAVVSGNGPVFYQKAGFWRAGQAWSDIRGHLSPTRYKHVIDRLNPPDYRKLSQNKIAEKALLTLFGIPTPRFIGVLDPAFGRAANGEPLRTASDLARVLEPHAGSRLCFKLIEGHGGAGFLVAEVLPGPDRRLRLLSAEALSHTDTPEISVDALFERLCRQSRLIESYLEQHPAYAVFNPSSVNTLRIWVKRAGQRTDACLAYLRIGRAGMRVDNNAAGGIVVPVDLDTGRLSEGLDGRPERVVFDVHPDTGVRLAGVVLPLFHEATRLAEKALTVFPRLTFAGMDVAVTPDGPAIIECNVQPTRTGAVFVGRPTSEILASGGRASR